MLYIFCFLCSAVAFVIGLTITILDYRRKKQHNPTKSQLDSVVHSLFLTAFISIYILVIPVNKMLYSGVVETIALSGIYTFKVFTTGASFVDFTKAMAISPDYIHTIYSLYGTFLFVFAPILSVGLLLSFFRQFSLKVRLFLGLYDDVYVFSELNSKTISLAKSCLNEDKKNQKRAIAIFADVDSKKDDIPDSLPAIYYKQNITELTQVKDKKNKELFIFVTGADKVKNINDTLELIKQRKDNENVAIYLFDDTSKSNVIISSALTDDVKVAVRRINAPKSLIYNYLYNNNIFKNVYTDASGEKHLNIKIFGFGNHGEEILKAYLWAGQMNDLSLSIDVYDVDKSAEERFYSRCPEIKKYNGNDIVGEAKYKLTFITGFNVNLFDFDNVISKTNPPSTIFIALGDDILNIDVAIKLRIACSRVVKDFTPEIISVVYNSNEIEIINDYLLTNEKGTSYQITAFGDVSSTYSYDTIINSKLEKAAVEKHLSYSKLNDDENLVKETLKYYKYDYYSNSSKAASIRKKLRIDYGVKGSDKSVDERTEEEKEIIRRIEHNGWNNYIRCEGYIFGERNDFAKTHNCLVPYDKLSEEDRIKDDV